MIVFCHLLNDNSGSPIVLRSVIGVLTDERDSNVLFVGSQGRAALEKAGVPIRRYWYRRSRFRLVTLVTFLASQASLYKALGRANIPADAIIYVNTLLPFGAALWGRRNNRRVVYHAHEVSISPGPLRRFLVGMASKTADLVFYVSEDQYSRLPVTGVPAKIVSNPVAPEIYARGAVTPYKARRSGSFEVLMLASPRDFKGIPEFLDLARRFAARPDVRFMLVLNGDPAEVEEYLPRSRRPENVTVHARTDTPADFYARADILLNLSRPDQCVETFGLTIVEAMAFGVPVIVPPLGGPSEIVTDGKEGFLVDSRDTERLYQRVAHMMDDPDLVQTMSQAARARAADYTLDRFTGALRAQMSAIASGAEKSKRVNIPETAV